MSRTTLSVTVLPQFSRAIYEPRSLLSTFPNIQLLVKLPILQLVNVCHNNFIEYDFFLFYYQILISLRCFVRLSIAMEKLYEEAQRLWYCRDSRAAWVKLQHPRKAIRTWAIAEYYRDVRDVSSIILIAEITVASTAVPRVDLPLPHSYPSILLSTYLFSYNSRRIYPSFVSLRDFPTAIFSFFLLFERMFQYNKAFQRIIFPRTIAKSYFMTEDS